ncbi:MAG: hypothetical protein ACSHW1_06800 [Yoonia sp.]|uniref:hypothetical protein n=1 Tax=Yoonia sp. TaxID=2212373 RepID=UPI003EF0DFCE
MAILEVIGFFFTELAGILDWSRRSTKERWQTIGAWALVVALISAGYWLRL